MSASGRKRTSARSADFPKQLSFGFKSDSKLIQGVSSDMTSSTGLSCPLGEHGQRLPGSSRHGTRSPTPGPVPSWLKAIHRVIGVRQTIHRIYGMLGQALTPCGLLPSPATAEGWGTGTAAIVTGAIKPRLDTMRRKKHPPLLYRHTRAPRIKERTWAWLSHLATSMLPVSRGWDTSIKGGWPPPKAP